MKYTLVTSKNFLRDLKTCKKRGYNIDKLWDIISKLQNGTPLPSSCRPHKLSGNHVGEWECHIGPDWLLIWEQNDTELTLLMLSTGTHSDLF